MRSGDRSLRCRACSKYRIERIYNPVEKAPKRLRSYIGSEFNHPVEKAPKRLRSYIGSEFNHPVEKYKNPQNSWSKLNLWDTTSAALYYLYHHDQGNKTASAIVTALISTTIDIIIDDRFGRVYKQGEAESRVKARLAGKYIRRTFTDACKSWYDRPQ